MTEVAGSVRNLAIKQMTQGRASCLSSWASHEERFKKGRSDNYRSHVGWQCINLAWRASCPTLFLATPETKLLLSSAFQGSLANREASFSLRDTQLFLSWSVVSLRHTTLIQYPQTQWTISQRAVRLDSSLSVKNLRSCHASRGIAIPARVGFPEWGFSFLRWSNACFNFKRRTGNMGQAMFYSHKQLAASKAGSLQAMLVLRTNSSERGVKERKWKSE